MVGQGIATQQLLVGVDGGPGGWQALGWATEEAAGVGGRLTVCHVHEPMLVRRPVAHVAAGEVPDRAGRRLLQDAVATARALLPEEQVNGAYISGDPATELIRLSADADCTVVGADQHRGPAAEVGPWTALRVAAGARSRAVVVPRSHGTERGPFAGHVVVGVDNGPATAAALEWAFRYAERHRRPLAAVHVSEAWPGDFWIDDDLLEVNFAGSSAALTMLAEAVEPLHAAYPQVHVKRAVWGGRPARGLPRAAAQANILVVGHHSHALRLLGTVCRSVVTHAPCTVAVVRQETAR